MAVAHLSPVTYRDCEHAWDGEVDAAVAQAHSSQGQRHDVEARGLQSAGWRHAWRQFVATVPSKYHTCVLSLCSLR